ncbi:MAG: carbohydrate porin [Verrucomicrobia bacterium]|nr:carbohydrate porin [Verrucomicrobiota bacterium]
MMRFPESIPGLQRLTLPTLAASLSLLTPGALFAQSADQSQLDALKSQMQQMQRQYEQRIDAMESQMKTLESKADQGSILNTRVLTDSNGTEWGGKEGKGGPVLDESFLKSLTRNFTFSAYVRAGVQFNGNGGGGNFNFEPPDNDGGRPRLGNENDTYMELTWAQAHLLGDSPDVMDVSMTFTPAIRYVQNRGTFIGMRGSGPTTLAGTPVAVNREDTGNDFDFVLRQAYLEMKNVFKGAPEITFWGGIRFYDRFNIDPNDYFYLDQSGYGAGVENIDVGIGKIWLAYIGGLDNDLESFRTGSFYKHNIDLRLKDIDIGFGKLMLIALGSYEKGTTFDETFDNQAILLNPVHTNDAWGGGVGAVWQYDFGNKSFLQLYALFGWGATNFGSSGTNIGTIETVAADFLARHPGYPVGALINTDRAIEKAHDFKAGGQFIWNIASNFSMSFWAFWNQDTLGYGPFGTNAVGTVVRAAANRNEFEGGIRPIFWVSDNFAIQGQAWGSYQDNNRGYSGTSAFGRSGSMGVFTIAPTLKPKGGYFTRPELRFFATWAIWSNSLKGTTTPSQEGGNFGGAIPPYNGNTNQGWLFGTQVEWFF